MWATGREVANGAETTTAKPEKGEGGALWVEGREGVRSDTELDVSRRRAGSPLGDAECGGGSGSDGSTILT